MPPPAPVIPANAGNHVTPSPRGFDVSPPPRKGEGQGGGRSPCDQCRLPPAGRPLPNLPPAGEGTRGFGKGVPRHPRPTRHPASPDPSFRPRTRHSGESRKPRPPCCHPPPSLGRQPTQSQKSPKSNESQFKTKPPPRYMGNGRQQPQEPPVGWGQPAVLGGLGVTWIPAFAGKT